MRLLGQAMAALAAGCCFSLAANATSFTFNSEPAGTHTAFSLTAVDGLIATFSSPGDPGGFLVQAATAMPLSFSGNVLAEPGTSGQSGYALDIAFSAPVTSFSGAFATVGNGPLDLTAMAGGLSGTIVGTTSAAGTIPGGYTFPEGTISFSGAAFDTMVLRDSADPYFALSNFSAADAADIAEPSSVAVFAAGLAGLALVRGRRRAL